jgi:hypothetical protein
MPRRSKTRKRRQLYGGEEENHEAIVKDCSGLGDCEDDITKFRETINNENCPFQEEKIKELVKCYNKNNKKPLNIDIKKNSLMELLDTEEDINDLQKATEWLEEKVLEPRESLSNQDNIEISEDDYDFNPREALSKDDYSGGKRRIRKSRRSRRSKKSRKSRRSRRPRKSRRN